MSQDVKLRLSVSGQAQVVGALGEVERATDGATGALRSLAGALGIGLSVKAVIDAADAVTTLHNSLKLATGSVQAASVAYERLFQIAQSSRTSFTDLGATFASISRAAGSLGLSQERLLGVTQAIGNAMTISGGSAESMKDALVQLGQGLASGTLRGDELNSVLEQTPRLAQALADGLGVGIGELRKLGEAGSLTAEKVIGALEKSAPQLAKEVQGATLTVGQAFTLLSNSATKFIGEADKATGASNTLASAMKSLSGAIDTAGEFIRKHEVAFGLIGGTLGSAAAAAVGIVAVSTAIKGVAFAVGLLDTALLANPVVLTLLGIGAVAGGIAAANNAVRNSMAGMANEITDLTRRINEAQKTLDAIGSRGEHTSKLEERVKAMRARLAELQQTMAAAQAGQLDTRAEDARFQRSAQQYAQEQQSLKDLTEIRAKLANVDKDYLPTLEKLQRARELGTISEKDYIAQVTDLAKQTYKASEEQKKAAQAAEQNKERVKSLTEAVDAKVAAGQLELQQLQEHDGTQQQLTKAQQYALEVMEKLRTGEVKLTTAEAEQLRVKLEKLDANERERMQLEADAKWAQQSADENARAIEQAQHQANSLQEQAKRQQEANEAIGLSAIAVAELEAARLRDAAATKEQFLANHAMTDPSVAQAWREQAKALRDLADAKVKGATKTLTVGLEASARRELDAFLDPAKAQTFGEALRDAFGAAGSALGNLTSALGEYGRKQAEIEKQRANLTKIENPYERWGKEVELNQKATEMQVASYADLAGAAKGFFDEGSRGYKNLQAAETAFRIYQLGSDLVKGASAAAVGIANQAQGDPYTAIPRMAAMAAVMASLGFAVSGGFSSAGSAPTTNTGTGTVFGDADAKSESIANALKQLTEVDTLTMRYSAEMLDALRSIESSLAGVTSLVLRNGALTTGSNLGIFQGTLSVNRGDPVLSALGLGGDTFASKLPGVGSTIAKLQSLWGKTTQEISSAGLYLNGLLSQLQAGGGVQQYADVKTTKSSMFGLSKKVSYGTQFAGVDDTIASQFAAIFTSFDAAIDAAAGPLGVSLGAIEQRLAGFVVDIGRIDLKGLTGEQIQEKLSAVLGAAGDRIAAAALPGLQRYQAVGEGYLETVVRVAYTVETVSETLKRLGSAALQAGEAGTAAAMSLADAFGGLDELTKQTAAYYEAIYSDGDKLALSQQRLSDAFAQYLMKVPATTEEYRKLVEAQDLGTASGRAMYATLVQLAPAYAEVRNALDEQAAAASEAAQRLAEEAAQKAAAVAQERTGLEQQLLQLQGNSAELRRRELAALDPSNRALQARIYALQDAQAAEQAAAAVAQQRAGLEQQLLQLQGNTAALRSRELAALDPSLRALQQRIYLLQDEQAAEQAAQAIAQQRAGLEQQLLQLQGNTAALRQRELAELDPANRSLQERIYILQEAQAAEQAAAQAAQAAQQQRISLEQQLLQLQGNTAELRRRELAALEPSSRALQQQIYTLQDYQTAQQAAAQAAQAAEQQRQALLQQQANMEQQLLQLQGATATLRQRELAALDPSLRALQQRIYALQDEQAAAQAAQVVAQEREGLERQLLQLQGNTAALRGRELRALDPSNHALQERIYVLQDAQAAEQAATQAAEQAAQVIAQQRAGLEQQLLQLQGDTAELRRRELAELDPANRSLQERIYILQDAQAAEQAAAQAAQAAQQQRSSLEQQLLQLQGNTAELRRRELAALDPTNRAMQQQIYTLQEYQAAQQAAAQAAQEAEAKRQALLQQQAGMEQQLLQLQGATATLRQRELAALDPSLRTLQERIYALQDEQAAEQAAQAIAQQRAGLEQTLLQLQGDTAALRGRELMALDPSNRALQERIYALQDAQAAEQAATQAAQAVAQQREGLEQQLLQLQGDTAELRRRELAALDPSNRALQERIYALQDEQAAAAEALKLRDAWKALGETIADEIRRIRGLSSTGTARSFVELQAQFATTTAQARAGDQAAAKALPELSKALLEAAGGSAATATDLARIQAATAVSLEETMRALSALGVEVPAFASGGSFSGGARLVGERGPELEITGPSRIYSAEQTAALLRPRADTARLEAQVEQLRRLLEDFLREAQATTGFTGRVARLLERLSPDGDALAIRTAE